MSRRSRHDVRAAKALSESVRNWASYQNLAGEDDCVETSLITGTYDWRAYLREEATLAQRREERNRPREKKVERAAPAPAPSHLYV